MLRRSAAFDDLCACFRGPPPRRANWTSIIGLANQTFTTTALKSLVDDFPRDIPPDVASYINHLFELNLIRNTRLKAQLVQMVVALNDDGIVPVLLKGSSLLATKDRRATAYRLISDLDILVAPHEFDKALKCSIRLGYRIHYRSPPEAAKGYADLGRPEDAAMIDLQQERPGHRFFYRSHRRPQHYCKLLSGEQGTAYVPSASYQALMLVFHDAFQDYDYWLGIIDLRHVLDLRDLINAQDGSEWNDLVSLTPSRLARNALAAQFLTLQSLLGIAPPLDLAGEFVPSLQRWRRVLQARKPSLKYPLLLLNLLDYWTYRAEIARMEEAERQPSFAMSPLPKASTLSFLLSLARERRFGKN